MELKPVYGCKKCHRIAVQLEEKINWSAMTPEAFVELDKHYCLMCASEGVPLDEIEMELLNGE